tara:strand:- start:188 stop:571 length:384 start_codon:yes stop_codon:yes gene_type:complete
MNDIGKIKAELVSHLRVELPYTFERDTHIKYLTLKEEDELFYKGGGFCCQKGNSIILNNCGRQWKVPINYYDIDGDVTYTTSFFIATKCDTKDFSCENKRKDEIIIAQQEIIQKLTNIIKIHEYPLD